MCFLQLCSQLHICKLVFAVHIPECKNMTYGPDCARQCKCNRNNTVGCDPQTGACQCLDTWTGPNCLQDIDECLLRIDHCLPMSDCLNTQGGRRCICREIGHEESENGTCGRITYVSVLFYFVLPLLRKYMIRKVEFCFCSRRLTKASSLLSNLPSIQNRDTVAFSSVGQ